MRSGVRSDATALAALDKRDVPPAALRGAISLYGSSGARKSLGAQQGAHE